jgi:putative endonuclease
MKKGGIAYILTNAHHTVFYVGSTSEPITRMYQHKNKVFRHSFTAKYNCDILVYYESFHTIDEAIARERQLKNWKRDWKIELINKLNPGWKDLSGELG